MLTSVRGCWVNFAERRGVYGLDEMERGISCSAEGAPCDCDRDGSNCQFVEDGQRVERGGGGVKWENDEL